MEETLTCVCCGAEVHRDEVCFVGDQPLCRDCADEETFVCDNCGFRHWDSDNQGDDRYDLCPSCREEYFVACSECGRLIPNSEAWYDGDDDETPPYPSAPSTMTRGLMISFKICPTSVLSICACKPGIRLTICRL